MIVRKRNPVAVKKLQDKTRYLVRTGRLHLPDICFFCKKTGCDEIHHIDYSDNFNVVRVHKSCHRIFHNKDRVEKYVLKTDISRDFSAA